MISGWELTLFLSQIVFCISQIFFEKEEKECHIGKINWSMSDVLASPRVRVRFPSQRFRDFGGLRARHNLIRQITWGWSHRKNTHVLGHPRETWGPGGLCTRSPPRTGLRGSPRRPPGNGLRRYSRHYGAPCPRQEGQTRCLESASVSSGGQPPAIARPPVPNAHLFRGVFLYVPHLSGRLHHHRKLCNFTNHLTQLRVPDTAEKITFQAKWR